MKGSILTVSVLAWVLTVPFPAIAGETWMATDRLGEALVVDTARTDEQTERLLVWIDEHLDADTSAFVLLESSEEGLDPPYFDAVACHI